MKRTLFPLLWLACALAHAGVDSVTLELRPQLRVGSGPVTLGQVALLNSTDFEAMRALVDLPIGRVSTAGQGAIVDRVTLTRWIRHRTGIAQERLQWQGPQSVEISVAQRFVRGEELALAAESALRAWLSAQGSAGPVDVESVPRDFSAPDGDLRLQVRPLAQAPLRNRMLVWVDAWVAERFVRTTVVAFQVPSVAGAPIGDKALRAPLAVERGQSAALRSGAGAVLSEARVEVLQDGRLGDRVRVRQPGAPLTLLATVVGAGQLEVAR
jgi:flagella basal body P-ring formation protein FlgA